MIFKFTYHKDKRRRSKPVRESESKRIGAWRSRWERKRDLDRRDPHKDRITRIFTRGTDKDYIVTEVHGVSPDNLYFKAVPIQAASPPKEKKKRGHDLVEVKTAKRCTSCGNFIRRITSRKHSTTQKTKSKHKKGK